MACFGGPSYSEINIESKPFIPVTVNLHKAKKLVELVNLNGELYASAASAAGGSGSGQQSQGKRRSILN